MRILGITGLARHGKDTTALIARERGWKRYAFADNVRRSLWALDPMVRANGTEYVRLREYVGGFGLVEPNGGSGPGWDEAKQSPEVRRLLQAMGTEAVRDVVSPDAWVMATRKQLDEEQPTHAMITDVRFPNEASALERWGGTLIRVVRLNPDGTPFESGVGTQHASERYVATLPVDVELSARSVEELTEKVNGVLDVLDFEAQHTSVAA